MPEYNQWPFVGGAKAQGSHGAQRAKDSEDEHARMAKAEYAQLHRRSNRLIVGGRAHTKKRGLS